MQLGAYLKAQEIEIPTFARDIAVSVQAVHRYVKGERIPTQDVMARIVAKTAGQVQPNDFYPRAAA